MIEGSAYLEKDVYIKNNSKERGKVQSPRYYLLVLPVFLCQRPKPQLPIETKMEEKPEPLMLIS